MMTQFSRLSRLSLVVIVLFTHLSMAGRKASVHEPSNHHLSNQEHPHPHIPSKKPSVIPRKKPSVELPTSPGSIGGPAAHPKVNQVSPAQEHRPAPGSGSPATLLEPQTGPGAGSTRGESLNHAPSTAHPTQPSTARPTQMMAKGTQLDTGTQFVPLGCAPQLGQVDLVFV